MLQSWCNLKNQRLIVHLLCLWIQKSSDHYHRRKKPKEMCAELVQSFEVPFAFPSFPENTYKQTRVFALPRWSPWYTILIKYYSSLRNESEHYSNTTVMVGDINADYCTMLFLRKREWQYTKSSTILFSVWKTSHTLLIDKFSTDNVSLSTAFDMVCNPDSA